MLNRNRFQFPYYVYPYSFVHHEVIQVSYNKKGIYQGNINPIWTTFSIDIKIIKAREGIENSENFKREKDEV